MSHIVPHILAALIEATERARTSSERPGPVTSSPGRQYALVATALEEALLRARHAEQLAEEAAHEGTGP